jgi:hypothetical protein
MEQTSSLSERVLKAAGLLPAVVLASTTFAAAPLAAESMVLVTRGVLRSPTVSRPERLMGEARSWNETKAARVRALRGKYRDVLSPSDEFARQKAQEIVLEG